MIHQSWAKVGYTQPPARAMCYHGVNARVKFRLFNPQCSAKEAISQALKGFISRRPLDEGQSLQAYTSERHPYMTRGPLGRVNKPFPFNDSTSDRSRRLGLAIPPMEPFAKASPTRNAGDELPSSECFH